MCKFTNEQTQLLADCIDDNTYNYEHYSIEIAKAFENLLPISKLAFVHLCGNICEKCKCGYYVHIGMGVSICQFCNWSPYIRDYDNDEYQIKLAKENGLYPNE